MANMSYCRFENTYKALSDCYDNMDDDELSEDEEKHRRKLVRLCYSIANEYDEDVF